LDTMKTKHTDRKLLTVTATARHFGRSRGTVHNWIAAGCPTHNGRLDPAEVEAWAVHRKRGPVLRHLAKAERDRTATKPATADPVAVVRAELDSITAALEHPEGVEGAIARLRAMERAAFKLYADIHGDTEAGLTRAKLHSDITGHLLKAEAVRDVRAEIRREEQTLMMDAMTEWWGPVRAGLEQMPRHLAPRVNPSDAPHAETALREWMLDFWANTLHRAPEPKGAA